MCGIAGFLGAEERVVATGMNACLAHRGPDSAGMFEETDGSVTLLHRRLAIIDLSPLGEQPMTDASGRIVMVYNGEIYNYRELRRDLEQRGARFKGHSDSEVLLELFARDGVACFTRLNGIFTAAFWNRETRALTLVRDGMGVKPLYYSQVGERLAFASELKALLSWPHLDRSLDTVAASAYLTYLYSPGERTMFAHVRKLAPGSWLEISGARTEQGQFYSPPGYAPRVMSDADAIAGTRARLETAVERQMIADVEVGAYLSGGLDSSAIVALARPHARSSRLRCFTIDYAADPSEAVELVPDLPYARDAARALGVDLHEVRVDSSMALDLERLVYQLDEPQADPAALNSYYIATLARNQGIKVLLSGAGGDDLFTGYRRHAAAQLDRLWARIPAPVRALAAGFASGPAGRLLGRRGAKLLAGVAGTDAARLGRLFEWLPAEEANALLATPHRVGPEQTREAFGRILDATAGYPAVERVLRLEQHFFLVDHNLNYTDKTGMAASVEVRVPFLDPDLMAWAASLPVSHKMRGGDTKWVLRKAMEPVLPHDIIYRPKTGFGVPLRAWLRKPMRPMLEELTSKQVLEQRGLFDPHAVDALKKATLAGQRDGSYSLLAVMMIELWCRRFGAATA